MKFFIGEDMSHVAHLLASIFLCGLWLPIWILAAAIHKPIYRCSFCGFTDETKYLFNPNLRRAEAENAKARSEAVKRGVAATGGGLKSIFLSLKNYEHINKIGVIFFMFCVVSAAIILSLPRSKPEVVTNSAPQVVAKPVTAQEAVQFVFNNYGTQPFYRNIKAINIYGATARATTDLSAKDERLLRVCGALSEFVFFNREIKSLQKVEVFDAKGNLVVERVKYQDPCAFKIK